MPRKDKVAVVTGAASGIGKNIARTFVAEGAKVIITDLNQKGDATAAELNSSGKNATSIAMDVTDGSQVEAGMEVIELPDPHEPPLWIAGVAIFIAVVAPLFLFAVSRYVNVI